MTKRVHIGHPEYPARRDKTVPGPVLLLIGACAGLYGFSNQSMDEISFPEIAQIITADLQHDAAEAREMMARYFPR